MMRNEKKKGEVIQHMIKWLEYQKIFKNQNEIAKYLHISSSHLSNIINGRKEADSDLVNKIIIMTEFENSNSPSYYPSEKRPYLKFTEEFRMWFSKQKRWKTQKELAEFLDMPYSSFKKFFQGRSFPKGEIRKKLYQVTNIEMLRLDGIKTTTSNESDTQNQSKMISIEDHVNKIEKSMRSIQTDLESLKGYINENKKTFQIEIKNITPYEKLANSFYDLAEVIISFRKSDKNQREKIRQMISPKDVGYVISFLKALFDEDKFSDFIFFSKYDFEKRKEK